MDFIARQPIFDRHEHVWAYELLFRAGPQNVFSAKDGDRATAEVVKNALYVFGLDALTGEKKAFINLTRSSIVEDFASILPPGRVVLEILETVEPDDEVLAACRKLKESGYVLALDDFVFQPEMEPLCALADIIKVDFIACKEESQRRQTARFIDRGIKLLAEKVETHADVASALAAGYSYMQGYFFCRPEMVSRKEIPAYKLSCLRFLQQVNRPELDLEELEKVIKQDLSLSVKLLRFINSAALSLRSKVESIHWALVILGEQPIRRWASLVALTELGSDKPTELAVTTLVRARLCELVGAEAAALPPPHQLFFTGMLSAIDAMMDRPLAEILAELPVAPEIKEALQGAPSPLGRIFALVRAYEQGEWETVESLARELRVPEDKLAELYQQAITWTGKVFL